jgi:hypothetical protein
LVPDLLLLADRNFYSGQQSGALRRIPVVALPLRTI